MMEYKLSPLYVEITGVKELTPTVKVFTLDLEIKPDPGQFCMLWIPGVGEKPFGFSRVDGRLEIMVRKVGEFTERMFLLEEGEMIGFRGPYGQGFSLQGERICFVSGGVGIAPLLPLIRVAALSEDKNVHILHGAKTEQELVPLDSMDDLEDADIRFFTDDGSCGLEGNPCPFLEQNAEKYDAIYGCGPEVMLKKIADTALENNIFCMVSLERYIKCGIGVCGHCSLDPTGLMVCKDGPVFDIQQLKNTEFGKYRRDKAGSKIKI